jgi:hypothetical protein
LDETGLALRSGGGLLGKYFDGDQAIQAVVASFVDRAHASLAQFFEDIEMRIPTAEWSRRHVL